jgi:hypothetical protein
MNNPQAATQTKELTVPGLTSKQKLILFLQADVWWEKLQDEGCSDQNLERELLEEYGGGRTNGKTYLRMVPWLQFFDTPDPNKKAVLFEKTECLNAIREVLQIPREGETKGMVAKTEETTKGTKPRLRKAEKSEQSIDEQFPGVAKHDQAKRPTVKHAAASGKQEHLPGMEPPKIKLIKDEAMDAACKKHHKAQAKRISVQKDETDAYRFMQELMRTRGWSEYIYEQDGELWLVAPDMPANPKLKHHQVDEFGNLLKEEGEE